MRRATLLLLVAIVAALPSVFGGAPQTQPQVPKGKVLVKQLPGAVEGVELKDGVLRLKPDYKFVRRAGNRITVEKMSGGGAPQAGGSWICDCQGGSGGCSTLTDGSYMFCNKSKENGCKEACVLTVITDGVKRGVIIY